VHKFCAEAFGTNTQTRDSNIVTGQGAALRGTPNMDVVPTDEKNVRRAIRTGVGDALRNHYRDVLKEAIPTRLTELLEHLNEPQRDGPGFSQAGDKK
jgi:Anti-sigma factor NepR